MTFADILSFYYVDVLISKVDTEYSIRINKRRKYRAVILSTFLTSIKCI